MKRLIVFAVGLALATPAYPQDAGVEREDQPAQPGQVRQPVTPPEDEGDRAEQPFSLDVGVDVKTAYFFRGYNLVEGGLIVQPEATLTYNRFTVGPFAVRPYLGVWGNFVEGSYGEGGDWPNFNEFDATAGAAIETGPLSLELILNYYTNPDQSARDTYELGLDLSLDDSGITALPFALNPHASVFRETRDDNGGEDTYLETGVGPEFEITDQLSLSVPVNVGMSLDGYYTDSAGRNDTLGYLGAGVILTCSLTDSASLHVGGEYLRLFADSVREANGDEDAFVGTLGLSFSL